MLMYLVNVYTLYNKPNSNDTCNFEIKILLLQNQNCVSNTKCINKYNIYEINNPY